MNKNKKTHNIIKFFLFILFMSCTYIHKSYAEKFVVTGHVYANINEFEYVLEDSKKNNIGTMFLLGDIKNQVLNKIPFYENKYDIKIYTVPGNHEFPNAEYGENYIKRFGNFSSIIKGSELYILLNTMENNGEYKKFNHAGYGIEGKQFEFLKNTIKSTNKNISTINIFMHHSLFMDQLTQKEIKNIINNSFNRLNSDYINKQKYLSNDLTKNNWYKNIHELLKKEVVVG
jgi:hypothetical protein